MDFSVLNESSLHNTLKLFYAEQTNGKTEIKEDGHIYDIVTQKNEIIEIQTKNLSKLLPKIQDCLEKKRIIKLVHPVVIQKIIITTDEMGAIISKRKSPVKGHIYDLFKELTGIYPVLLHENFSLDAILINQIETRLKTSEVVQSKNKNRRFKKDWIKINKRLEDILEIKTFNTQKDYISLLPENLPEEFCSTDLKTALKSQKTVPARIYNNSNLPLWVLSHMEIIYCTKTEKRTKYYKINK